MKETARLLLQFEGDTSVNGAIRFVKGLAACIGPGFHPDTPFGDYVPLDDGQTTIFNQTEGHNLDLALARAADILTGAGIDICEIAAPVQIRQLEDSGKGAGASANYEID